MTSRRKTTPPPPRMQKLKLGIVGLEHGHVYGALNGRADPYFDIVGIAENNSGLIDRMMSQYSLPVPLFETAETMIKECTPDAVAVYLPTNQHRAIVDLCTIMDVDVMVEKPLATTVSDAIAIEDGAPLAGINVITNYQTTWYPSIHYARRLIDDGGFGKIRKIVYRFGHMGPKEIGVDPSFLDWLNDPIRNGGGALFDFGCYGLNISTWLLGERPTSLSCTTQNLQPEVYPEVDDEATMVVKYPSAHVVIQASWNWPIRKKEMTVYCDKGVIHIDRESYVRLQTDRDDMRRVLVPVDSRQPRNEFDYLADVVRGEIDPSGSLSSLENNVQVVKLLDAARRSACLGSTVLTSD